MAGRSGLAGPGHVAAVADGETEMRDGLGYSRQTQHFRPHARTKHVSADVGRRPDQADTLLVHAQISIKLKFKKTRLSLKKRLNHEAHAGPQENHPGMVYYRLFRPGARVFCGNVDFLSDGRLIAD